MAAEQDRGWTAVVLAVARRPRLWATALVQARRLAPPGWWRTRPFLPKPPAGYIAFRQLTATGSPDGTPKPDDVIAWLAWCREWDHQS